MKTTKKSEVIKIEIIQMNGNQKLALNRQETAKALGISAPTLARLTGRGLIRPSRATKKPLYSIFEIKRFLEETSETVDPISI